MNEITEDNLRERLGRLKTDAPTTAPKPNGRPNSAWWKAPACLLLGLAIGIAGKFATTPKPALSNADMQWLTLQFAKAQGTTPNAARQFLETGLDAFTD